MACSACQNCAKSMQEALGRQDYEGAAMNVQRYRHFDPAVVGLVFAESGEERETLRRGEAGAPL